jgi:NADPH:quinone reductase-like Zn-dependent oxidoreductase
MRGVVLEGFDTASVLRNDLPAPTVSENQVLVRVHASSVNPVDAAIAGGMLRGMVDYEFPVVLGRDYTGVVERVGPIAAGYSEGDPRLRLPPTRQPKGSWCENYPIADATDALQTLATRHPQGKIAISIA